LILGLNFFYSFSGGLCLMGERKYSCGIFLLKLFTMKFLFS
jgi:hypothetical protein